MKTKRFPLKGIMWTVFFCLTFQVSSGKDKQPTRYLPFLVTPSVVSDVIGMVPDDFELIENFRSWVLGPTWRRYGDNKAWQKDTICHWGIVGPILQSKDKQCEILINSFLQEMPDEEQADGYFPFYPWRLHYRNLIMYDLLSVYDGKDDLRFADFVTSIGGSEARRRFNADSIFIFDVPIRPLVQDGEQYTHCSKMYIWRTSKSLISLAWFFTDEGKKREKHYIKKLNKHLWYKDFDYSTLFSNT